LTDQHHKKRVEALRFNNGELNSSAGGCRVEDTHLQLACTSGAMLLSAVASVLGKLPT
jgi:hypothetical protein